MDFPGAPSPLAAGNGGAAIARGADDYAAVIREDSVTGLDR